MIPLQHRAHAAVAAIDEARTPAQKPAARQEGLSVHADLQKQIGDDNAMAAFKSAKPQSMAGVYKAEPGGMYQTTGPFYSTTADASGDFSLSDVPVGGPYVLEVYADGNWTTQINPTTNQPADPVMVTPLVPVDLTFVVLSS